MSLSTGAESRLSTAWWRHSKEISASFWKDTVSWTEALVVRRLRARGHRWGSISANADTIRWHASRSAGNTRSPDPDPPWFHRFRTPSPHAQSVTMSLACDGSSGLRAQESAARPSSGSQANTLQLTFRHRKKLAQEDAVTGASLSCYELEGSP